MPIRLVLADDHPVVLAGLAQILEAQADCDVVACTRDGEEALAAIREHGPDVLVLDLRMPRKDGVAVLREMHQERLATRVVVLTAAEGDDVFEAIRLGARGVVLKDMAAQLLVDAVRRVYAGGTWIERDVAAMALDRMTHRDFPESHPLASLTPREMEVARMTAQGLSNKAVADRLAITEGTVKLHLHHVYEKLDLNGRMALARYLARIDA